MKKEEAANKASLDFVKSIIQEISSESLILPTRKMEVLLKSESMVRTMVKTLLQMDLLDSESDSEYDAAFMVCARKVAYQYFLNRE